MHTHVLVLFSDPKDPSLPPHAVKSGIRGQVRDRRYESAQTVSWARTKAEIVKAHALAADRLAARIKESAPLVLPFISALMTVFDAAEHAGLTATVKELEPEPKRPSWKKAHRGRQFGGTRETWRNVQAA